MTAEEYGRSIYQSCLAGCSEQIPLDQRSQQMQAAIRNGCRIEQEKAERHFHAGFQAALTRPFTISDEELMQYAPTGYHGLVEIRWIEALQDLRDRYEERGKYAPK